MAEAPDPGSEQPRPRRANRLRRRERPRPANVPERLGEWRPART